MNITSLVLTEKRVLVIGMGISGQSAAHFLLSRGACVHGVDRDFSRLLSLEEMGTLLAAGITLGSDTDYIDVKQFDLVVVSPGVPTNHVLLDEAKKSHLPIVGEIELACRYVENPMIGITGTNGKTTVTLLVAHILNRCGKPSHALGNVGSPFAKTMLGLSSHHPIILELSSYQIDTLHQRCLDSAIILNITPDHLDRYKTMEEYAKAKCAIIRTIKPSGRFYIEETTWDKYKDLCKDKVPLLYGYSPSSYVYTDLYHVMKNREVKFSLPPALQNKKNHNLENFLAAYAICSDQGIDDSSFLAAYDSFQKPPHRIEFIAEYEGIKFYDDSKGTNIDAVLRAVESMHGSVILIAGGVDKGSPYTAWIKEFKNKVKSICAIGQAADKMREQLASHFPVYVFHSLEEAVQQATQLATKGDNVLLSPGCSSLDMFKDYAHRGREFQRIVHEFRSNKRN